MNWPDIFFKARPARAQGKPAAKSTDAAPEAGAGSDPKAEGAPGTAGRLPVSQVVLPPAPVHSGSSDTSVVREMAEADTLREMTRSGGIRLIKRDFNFASTVRPKSASVPAFVPKTGAIPPIFAETDPKPAPPSLIETPAPIGKAETAEPPAPVAKAELAEPPAPVAKVTTAGSGPRSFPAINLSVNRDTTPVPVSRPAMTIFRRRTKIADVARIVLPPRRDEGTASRPPISAEPAPAAPQPAAEAAPAAPEPPASSSAVMPPSFPVEVPMGTVLQSEAAAAEMKPAEVVPEVATVVPEVSAPVETPIEAVAEPVVVPESATPPPPETENKTEVVAEPENKTEAAGEAVPSAPAEAPAPEKAEEPSAPEPSPAPAPVEETHAAEETPLATTPSTDTREKREFVLSNGERIFGHILSETPEAIYIDHGTLGVLTIPRNQIALRPVEIILINGDRIVGDIIAETADSLFVRHASLGILTVPRNQRSNRVVEAILKDGDRILGEVLGETENFTVIRSATLGTVAVPHNRVAMLNRRAEQVQMRALPAGSTELENKSAS